MARDRDDDRDDDRGPRGGNNRDRDDRDRDDDRPSRRRDRDDDDRPSRRRHRDAYDDDAPVERGPLDQFFRDTNMAVLILLAVCFNGLALVLGLVGVFTAKDPSAKKNATVVAAVGGAVAAIGVATNFVLNMSFR